MDKHSLILFAEAFDKSTGVIGYEGMTVEELSRRAVLLQPDAVSGDDRHRVGDGVALHGALPSPVRIERGVIGLGADGRWV